MARNQNNNFLNVDDIEPVLKNADMVKNTSKNERNYDEMFAVKPKFVETHSLKTMFIRNDLLDVVLELSTGKKGVQTEIFNTALEEFLMKIGKYPKK